MKRYWPQYRGTTRPPPQFVRHSADDQLNLGRAFSESGQRVRTKRFFIVRKTSRLRSTGAVNQKIRRILIFDNHPDSLRLVFGHSLDPYANLSRPRRVGVGFWELVIASILMIAGLVGIFWPGFETFAP
jgi:hypothetical protein